MSTESARLLSTAEVAARLGVSRKTVARYIHAGDLPSVKLGKSKNAPVRVPEDALSQWVAGRSELAIVRADANLATQLADAFIRIAKARHTPSKAPKEAH